MARPKRLVGISYTGLNAYFVTTCTRDRAKAFANFNFGRIVAVALLDHAQAMGFEVTAYCLMPDHAHLLLTALHGGSSLHDLMKGWKQSTGFAWARLGHGRLWQEGYWEHVLRDDEPMMSIARYLIENPIRARLVTRAEDYPLMGSSRYSVDGICAAAQWVPGRRN